MPKLTIRTYDAAQRLLELKLATAPADKRIDPEDKDAYAHFDKLKAEFDKRGKPVQLLRGGKPADGDAWDKLALAPPPGFESWVDVYESPEGFGYVTHYEAPRGGKTFRKSINVGPEAYREQDWTEVPPATLTPVIQ